MAVAVAMTVLPATLLRRTQAGQGWGGATPVFSSEAFHNRSATPRSRARRLTATCFGAPRSSSRPSGPNTSPPADGRVRRRPQRRQRAVPRGLPHHPAHHLAGPLHDLFPASRGPAVSQIRCRVPGVRGQGQQLGPGRVGPPLQLEREQQVRQLRLRVRRHGR